MIPVEVSVWGYVMDAVVMLKTANLLTTDTAFIAIALKCLFARRRPTRTASFDSPASEVGITDTTLDLRLTNSDTSMGAARTTAILNLLDIGFVVFPTYDTLFNNAITINSWASANSAAHISRTLSRAYCRVSISPRLEFFAALFAGKDSVLTGVFGILCTCLSSAFMRAVDSFFMFANRELDTADEANFSSSHLSTHPCANIHNGDGQASGCVRFSGATLDRRLQPIIPYLREERRIYHA